MGHDSARWEVVKLPGPLDVAMALCLAACGGHSGGDPRGVVLHRLISVAADVPPDATDVQTGATDASWQPACPDGTGRPGWSLVSVRTKFITGESESGVSSQFSAALRQQGWSRHDEVVTQGQGPVLHWIMVVGPGRLADTFVYPVPRGSDHWYVTASWQPPGAQKTGDCG